jgi:hypothetical protein
MIAAVISILAAAGSSAAGPLPPPNSAVQTQPPAASAPAAPGQKLAEKVVCRRTENTGSLLPGPKVCKTASEWAQIRRDSRDYVEATQHNGDQVRIPGS